MAAMQALTWTVGSSTSQDGVPERFVPAVVPGAVQLDWARANAWPDHNVGDHWREYRWMEDAWWRYRATLAFTAAPGERVVFVCKGIDYRFQIRLKGAVIHEQEGMFTPVELDLTGRAAPGDLLEVLLWPAPKSVAKPEDRVQANQSCKPAVSYGWDFHPRLIPLGIWDECGIEVRPASHVVRAETGYALADDFARVEVTLDVVGSAGAAGRLRWRLLADDGAVAFEREGAFAPGANRLTATLDRPRLWWPNGQGDAVLYRSVVEVLPSAGATAGAPGQPSGRHESRVGFRRVRLVMHHDAWEWPPIRQFPKSRSHPPITLEINGRAIFAKGSNWVSPDIFPGAIARETYRELLGLAKDAHMNIVRCWGGAIVQKDAFFDICDELGLMVWQEFPLACNRYEGTPSYLRVLDQESRSIIARLRHHASVVLWCGGNELFNSWSRMTDQDLALRLLNRNCYDLDPQRPFLMTSPVMGMGHGHYVFRSPEGKEAFQFFAEAECTAYTEFGCGGPASAELLRRIIPAADIFPPKKGTAWETHHAVAAWEPNSHLLLDIIERYFGPCATLEQIVERGQLMQGEGLKCLFEEARRQKPRASMALNWCLNEPWPTAANMSIVSWPAEPKPAYREVAAACRPLLASAKIARFSWREGELFAPELWLLNDRPDAVGAGRVEAFLRFGGEGAEEVFLLGWDHPALEANTNLAGPVVRFILPRRTAERMTLVLRAKGEPARDSQYQLLYASNAPAAVDAGETRRLNQ